MQKYKDELKIKKRKKLILRLGVFVVIAIVGLAGAVYILFFAELLNVRNVTIETPDGLRADVGKAVDNWLESGFWKLTQGNNILFLSANELASELARQLPKLESAKIAKKLPHEIIVSVSERKPAGIWCLAKRDKCFYFDKSGAAFSETQPSSGFLILNIIDRRARDLKLGEKAATDDWLANIVGAKKLLMKNEIDVTEFVIPVDSFDEFHAKTAEGWKIMFSNQTNIEKQISALATFLKEKISPSQRSTLQYIDLRIQDRIYYK